jgi:hypothetical protein
VKSRFLFVALPSFVAAIVAFPSSTSAQTEMVGWTRCTTGAFQSCQSLQLSTVAIFSGATRVGTDVTITMHNLSGQSPDDNTAWSGLEDVGFFSPSVAGIPFLSTIAPLSLSGGAVGTAAWQMIIVADRVFAIQTSSSGLVGGCTPGAFGSLSTSVLTCGPQATASLSGTFAVNLDASSYTSYSFSAFGQPAGSPYHYEGACTVFSSGEPGPCFSSSPDTPTPEPATLALVATGFLVLGAGPLWRRRKRDTV